MVIFLLFSVQFAPFANYLTNQVHSHTETALDTSRMKCARSSFPVKMHLVPRAGAGFLNLSGSRENLM